MMKVMKNRSDFQASVNKTESRARFERGLRSGGECEWEAGQDEGLTGNGAHAVVDARHEQIGLPRDPERLVHHRLVVPDDINTRELRKDLNERRERQPPPPLRHLEHDAPPGRGDGLLGVNGHLDLVELVLDPVVVRPVVVQLDQHALALVEAVGGDEVAGGLGGPEHADGEEGRGQGLEGKGEAPLEGGVGHVVAAVADPRRDDEADADHLLC